MKIIVLMGSPSRNGSTGILVENFKNGAEEAYQQGKEFIRNEEGSSDNYRMSCGLSLTGCMC